MKTTPTALIFDVDGTLADTEELHRLAFNEAFREHGLDWTWSPDLYAELLRITGGKERIAAYVERLDRSFARKKALLGLVPEIHATKTRLYRELMELGWMCPRPGVRRLMTEARVAGVPLAIASTTSPENVESLINTSFGSETLSWFSVIVTGDVVARKKPAPDVYELTLAKLGVPADKVIAFEDSAIGLASAKAAGLFTIVTPSPWTVGQDFSAADLVLPSLGDPEEPLPAHDERRVGAKFLGLLQLESIHERRTRTEHTVCDSSAS